MNVHMLFRRWVENRWVNLTAVLAIGVLLRYIHLADIPNGYFHDEAWSAAKAAAIVKGQEPPQVYFAENNGMDALHVYLIALLFQFTGPMALGSRIVSSLAGSLSILATYWAAWELLDGERLRHVLSLVAAFVVATLFALLTTSRSGWLVPSMTLITTASLAALFRARRLAKSHWFIVAGLLAGLDQYTYPTARFLPFAMMFIGALDVWIDRVKRPTILSHYLWLLVASAIVFAPLGYYFVHHPEWLWMRAQQTVDTPTVGAGQNIFRTLAGFSIRGDLDHLHNLPGRPLLDPILSVLFVAGLVICITRRRPAHVILLGWLVIFTLPVLLTEGAPSFRRWTGSMPAQAILIALGIGVIMQYLTRTGVWIRTLALIAVAGLLIASAVWSIATYFGPYATSPGMFWAYDSGIAQVADYIRTRPDTTVFLTPYDRFYEIVTLTLGERQPPIQSFNGLACTVFPETTTYDTEWVVITEKDDRTLPLIRQMFPNHQVVWRLNSPAGSYARAIQVPAGQTAQLELAPSRQANFGGKIRLIGYDLPRSALAGKALRIKIALEDVSPLDRLHKVFVHLWSNDNTVLAQVDRYPCDFSLNEADWRPGDIVLEEYPLPIPPQIAPGQYRVALGIYQSDSGLRLPALETQLAREDSSVILGQIEIK